MTDTLVLIPTYNNAATLADVVSRSLSQGLPVMVVDDGSTDSTPDILKTLESSNSQTLTCIRHPRNMGKGTALKTGFKEAKRLGYSYVITLDSDGQHFPEDIPVLLKEKGERSLVVGSRSIRGKDGSSSFANNFSNFWFRLYTWVDLPDTQTGYRMYSLNDLPGLWLLSSRYEAELTLLVFSAWKGLHLKPVPVKVAYPEDRVSHFHPVKDFARITLLNTILLIVALLYGYPRMMLQKIRR
ncbi:MAG: glycosyltransferase family 2 protein [Bacteroidales bacterium]|nr:glycosyltransferase family 2 protein [Bacteroidales bacterium]